MEDLESYWCGLRGRTKGPDALAETDVDHLCAWGRSVGQENTRPYIVVRGVRRQNVYLHLRRDEGIFDDPGVVHELFGANALWATEGVRAYLLEMARNLRLPSDVPGWRDMAQCFPGLAQSPWNVLAGLIAAPLFQLGPDLAREATGDLAVMVRKIVTARTKLRGGGRGVEREIKAMGEWVERRDEDLVLFLLSLARQNGVLGRVLLAFDRIELVETLETAKEILTLIHRVHAWAARGCPLGIVLGWSGSDEDRSRLQRLTPELLALLDLGHAGALVDRSRHEPSSGVVIGTRAYCPSFR